MASAMHKIQFTFDRDHWGPLIGEAMLMSVMRLPAGVVWKEFSDRQKRLRSAAKRALVKVEDFGRVKKGGRS